MDRNTSRRNGLYLSGPAWLLSLLGLVHDGHVEVVVGQGVLEARRGRVQGVAPLLPLGNGARYHHLLADSPLPDNKKLRIVY